MKNPRHKELEQIALTAELARQVVHDCRNFLYNVLLQIELAHQLAHENSPDWSGIKHEAQRLTVRLEEWQSFGTACRSELQEMDLNAVVQDVVAEWLPTGSFIQRLAPGPLWFKSVPNEVKFLCCLLLPCALGNAESAGTANHPLLIQTEKKAEMIVLRIGGIRAPGDSLFGLPGNEDDAGNRLPSLVIDTCKSIGVRLDTKIYLDNEAAPSIALTVEFPLELS